MFALIFKASSKVISSTKKEVASTAASAYTVNEVPFILILSTALIAIANFLQFIAVEVVIESPSLYSEVSLLR